MIWVWLGIAVVAIVAEFFMPVKLMTCWFGLSALIAMIFAILKIPVPVQIIVFLVVGVGCLFFLRKPVAERFLKNKKKKNPVSYNEKLVGLKGEVYDTIHRDAIGQVIVNGALHNAVSDDGSRIDEGTSVVVVACENSRLVVSRL